MITEKEKKDLKFKLEGLRIDLGALRNTYLKERDELEKKIEKIIESLYITNE